MTELLFFAPIALFVLAAAGAAWLQLRKSRGHYDD